MFGCFTIGPAVYVYGAAGPQYGSYAIALDGTETTHSAHSSTNQTLPYLLYSNTTLPYANHTITIRNLGASQSSDAGASAFLLDYILTTVQLAPQGYVQTRMLWPAKMTAL